MNRGVLQSSPVQQMMAAGNPNWWNINNMRPQQTTNQPSSALLPPPNLFPQFAPLPTSSSSSSNSSSSLPVPSSWHDNQDLPESWSQLLLGGLVGEEDKSGMLSLQFLNQVRKLENWEDQMLSGQGHQTPNPNNNNNNNNNASSHVSVNVVDVKQEHSPTSYVYGNGNDQDHHHQFQTSKPPTSAAAWSHHQIMASSAASNSSPKSSCVTSFSSNMLDFSNTNNHSDHVRHPPPDRSSECNSTATGGAPLKKARVQASSTQSTFKVRKEKLGDRITALHQLVSPFGKTDTASVLLEAIGYIRFLQSQIEALSLPYLGSGSGNMRQQQSVHGERNCMFPEDPGQLLNDSCMKRKGASDHQQDFNEEPRKDLRSRGLCLVPVSCTLQVGSDNGADYWAPALGGGFR
ncbi:hypothetical protein FEM48_Zijuj12G0037600 [Ziziphus jujuba var. spinosa]|uniref:BHLH domain-containing protein n=1 Tax=Ziziphus jujuba var. spinosa TaxID=714518 RepID=A0A978UB02_ZIZJJ|nr:hypothetical protein FEM48_Zijuj12G0037600 [Ziziphus jujuba var. spinosa]